VASARIFKSSIVISVFDPKFSLGTYFSVIPQLFVVYLLFKFTLEEILKNVHNYVAELGKMSVLQFMGKSS